MTGRLRVTTPNGTRIIEKKDVGIGGCGHNHSFVYDKDHTKLYLGTGIVVLRCHCGVFQFGFDPAF